ncbi:MAG TPA: HEPN domain-containing protein [Candidatus Portnoybacteria bacterium]|nr:HEPN domain-containing protein [Candidatus Portnoybacteria bacterium]
MKQEDVKKIIKYWQKTAEHDYETMIGLFKIKRYSDSLFFGHIILEKIIKALVVKETKNQAPRLHDLVRLQEIAKLKLSSEEVRFLNRINDFNIRARYPEYKLQFYKKCTKEYTEKYFNQIIDLYKKLCQELKQKK